MQGIVQNGVLTWVVGNDDSHVSTAIVLDERLKVLMRSGCAVQRENGDRFRRVALLQSVRVVYLQCQSFGHLCVHSLLGRPLLVQLSAGGDHYWFDGVRVIDLLLLLLLEAVLIDFHGHAAAAAAALGAVWNQTNSIGCQAGRL